MKYLVTGVAGFIGSAVAKKLIENGSSVVGIDNLNDYYDVNLKLARLDLITNQNFTFKKIDMIDNNEVMTLFENESFDIVINLGAQAGVRNSIENPHTYIDSNIIGYLNILEGCRKTNVSHLVYASSSSVYGLNKKMPFSTDDSVDHPVSLYAATKKSNELMSHCYSHLYGIPTTGLRFFTVYGPWGRPDMAPYIFTKKIYEGEIIDVNNYGDMWRDFTYIDDVVEGIYRVSNLIPTSNKCWNVESGTLSSSSAPYSIYNIGNGKPVNLLDFISEIEMNIGVEARKNYREMQPGDVYKTFANTNDLFKAINYSPRVSIEYGVSEFVSWYLQYIKR